ncbi:hypothetical protein FOXG_14302 [Fusarium oxysporum f. sp. lycopersici 4287]|uniref:Uncharacterized protein n=1 Tax=Fusarium oxysporum f. sp. lycopersici (strain 4287 / CBS 123668 / FGSC 9935 / NRRL 34936) TaxID=426428 RepID=A0A0J9VZS2_FUSO4|nr:hypothetical protein FOXG_14302 [Fusarium oxysporum f. sp. lycopersici 4287]KNB16439.1 hypothetical protein FOXG_14302 [Fusarium oxysporum f. sp. lycopersici 4287]
MEVLGWWQSDRSPGLSRWPLARSTNCGHEAGLSRPTVCLGSFHCWLGFETLPRPGFFHLASYPSRSRSRCRCARWRRICPSVGLIRALRRVDGIA